MIANYRRGIACFLRLALLVISPIAYMPLAATATELPSFEPIISDEGGKKSCLTVNDDSRSVSLQPCIETDAQQWLFVPFAGMQHIKNKRLLGSEPALCLFAGGINDIKMARCESTGGSDFNSKRMWRRDLGLLSNKYIRDLARPNFLSSNKLGQVFFGSHEGESAQWSFIAYPYQEVITHVDGAERCLTLEHVDKPAILKKCDGLDNQQWMFSPFSGWLNISNKSLRSSITPMCLGSTGGVKMMSCAGSGNDFSSRRMWRRANDGLANKYISDVGRQNYLQSTDGTSLSFGSFNSGSSQWLITKRYGYVRNNQKGPEACLALSENNTTVEFLPCRDDPRQDWRLSPIIAGYEKITNRQLAHLAGEKCLGSGVAMMDCVGAGYTSHRSWRYIRSPIDRRSIILGNKFRSDLGRSEVLGYSGATPQMVPASRAEDVSWGFELVPYIPIPRRPFTGDRKLLLLHTRYANRPPVDFEQVRNAVFGTGSDNSSFVEIIRAASRNQLRFTGDAVTGIDLGPRPSDCPGGVLKTKAIEAARQQGFQAEDYDELVVELAGTSCSWVGLASLPGRWMMSNGSGHKPWLWNHEFGHNLGAPHAGSLERCPSRDGVVQVGGAGCEMTSTGDPTDTMNGGGLKLYPAPYLFYAGWLNDLQFAEVVANGSYKIPPLFSDTALNVPKAFYLFRSDGSYLILEFRQPLAQFEDWPVSSPFVNGVIVRIAGFTGSTVSNRLVDTTPGSELRMQDAPLAQGRSIDDLLSGKRITVTRIDSTGATVQVQDIPKVFERAFHADEEIPPAQVIED